MYNSLCVATLTMSETCVRFEPGPLNLLVIFGVAIFVGAEFRTRAPKYRQNCKMWIFNGLYAKITLIQKVNLH